MSMPTRSVGGVSVGCIGYGAMNLTWKPKQAPDEQAFEAIKTAVDLGSNMVNCECRPAVRALHRRALGAACLHRRGSRGRLEALQLTIISLFLAVLPC